MRPMSFIAICLGVSLLSSCGGGKGGSHSGSNHISSSGTGFSSTECLSKSETVKLIGNDIRISDACIDKHSTTTRVILRTKTGKTPRMDFISDAEETKLAKMAQTNLGLQNQSLKSVQDKLRVVHSTSSTGVEIKNDPDKFEADFEAKAVNSGIYPINSSIRYEGREVQNLKTTFQIELNVK